MIKHMDELEKLNLSKEDFLIAGGAALAAIEIIKWRRENSI